MVTTRRWSSVDLSRFPVQLFLVVAAIALAFVSLASCSSQSEPQLKLTSVRNDVKTYTLDFRSPLHALVIGGDQPLFTNHIEASDLDIDQNVRDGKTLSFQLKLPTLTFAANIDGEGNVVGFSIHDGKRDVDMVWDKDGNRIR